MDHETPAVFLREHDGSSDIDTMAEIGGLPVLWHVMKLCEHHGFRRFVLAVGDRGWTIKRFFLDLRKRSAAPDWRITFVDTGTCAGTGARLRRVRQHLDGGHVLVTGLDGIGPVDLTALAREHVRSGRIGTVTTPPQLGAGGFAMFRRGFLEECLDDDPDLELARVLQRLARDGELGVLPG